MKRLGEIFLDKDGYVVITGNEELGKLIEENGVQSKFEEICDLIAEILSEIKY